jgi:hypothetical protein
MAESSTSFKKGKSGNPRGRPPKSRALTAMLAAAGGKKMVRSGSEKGVQARRVLAELIWDAATTGMVKFDPAGEAQALPPKEWVSVVKFLYEQIDGPAPAAVAVDMTTQGQPLGITMVEVIKTARPATQE